MPRSFSDPEDAAVWECRACGHSWLGKKTELRANQSDLALCGACERREAIQVCELMNDDGSLTTDYLDYRAACECAEDMPDPEEDGDGE